MVEKVGAYELFVTASPYPLQVGENDISVLMGRLSDGQIVLDTQVTVIAEPIDPPGESRAFSATHDNATNKLYYAANVVFPTPGQWRLTIQVDGPAGPVSASVDAEVKAHQSPILLKYLGLVGVPLVVVLVVFVLRRRSARVLDGERPSPPDPLSQFWARGRGGSQTALLGAGAGGGLAHRPSPPGPLSQFWARGRWGSPPLSLALSLSKGWGRGWGWGPVVAR
jgi:hypothetical protein